jgi:hypothetical protein
MVLNWSDELKRRAPGRQITSLAGSGGDEESSTDWANP